MWLAQGTRLVKTPILDTPTTCYLLSWNLKLLFPPEAEDALLIIKYTVTQFELLDFVNRERGRVRVYICGRSGEYSVTYPARHLLFHPCVNPSTGDYGTMLYFSCDMIVFKLYTNLS